MNREPNYSYDRHGRDRYVGKQIYHVKSLGRDTYRIHMGMLARNTEGELGHIGQGVKWFLNWAADDGTWCFNPVKEEDLRWSSYHNAYFMKNKIDHFRFPIVIGEFYTLKDGKKFISDFYDEVQSHEKTRFSRRSKYF